VPTPAFAPHVVLLQLYATREFVTWPRPLIVAAQDRAALPENRSTDLVHRSRLSVVDELVVRRAGPRDASRLLELWLLLSEDGREADAR
jgi:hypothetical protein